MGLLKKLRTRFEAYCMSLYNVSKAAKVAEAAFTPQAAKAQRKMIEVRGSAVVFGGLLGGLLGLLVCGILFGAVVAFALLLFSLAVAPPPLL